MSAQQQAILTVLTGFEQQLAFMHQQVQQMKALVSMNPQTGYNQSFRAPQQQDRYTNPQEDAIIAERLQLEREAAAGGPVDEDPGMGYYPPQQQPMQAPRPQQRQAPVHSGRNQTLPPNMRATAALMQQILDQGG